MNLLLLDPFRQKFPDQIVAALSRGFALSMAVAPRGNLLATGTHEGSVIVWDLDTRSVARELPAHSQPVSTVAFTRTGRAILSGSLDATVAVHDVLDRRMTHRFDFDSAVIQVHSHPRDADLAVVVSFLSPTCLIRLSTGERWSLPEEGREEVARRQQAQKDGSQPVLPTPKAGVNKIRTQEANYRRADTVPTSVATFDTTGDRIYIGNAVGTITVIDTATREQLSHFNVTGSGAHVSIRSIRFGRAAPDQFLVNSTDKVVRLFSRADNSILQTFEDYVNRTPWRQCCFSFDGEYVLAATAAKSAHSIQCYSRSSGNLFKTVEGNIKEGMLDMLWHPSRPVILTLSTSGVCYVWMPQFEENWSAFAPDFKELEENEEYIEREDEFDICDDSIGKLEQRAGEGISITAAVYGPEYDEGRRKLGLAVGATSAPGKAVQSTPSAAAGSDGGKEEAAPNGDAEMRHPTQQADDDDDFVDILSVETRDPVGGDVADSDDDFIVPFDILPAGESELS